MSADVPQPEAQLPPSDRSATTCRCVWIGSVLETRSAGNDAVVASTRLGRNRNSLAVTLRGMPGAIQEVAATRQQTRFLEVPLRVVTAGQAATDPSRAALGRPPRTGPATTRWTDSGDSARPAGVGVCAYDPRRVVDS